MKKVLLVCYGGGHVNMLLPVAKLLSEKGVCVEFLALTTAINIVKETKWKYYTYKDFFTSSEVRRYGLELLQSLNIHKTNNDETISYLGQNFNELQEKYGIIKAKELYKKNGRMSFYPIDSLVHILNIIKPNVVVATSTPRSEKAAIDASRKLGIPSLALGDLFLIRPFNWFKKNSFATKVCVFNNKSKIKLIKAGREESSVVVTGNPAFDSLILKSNLVDFSKRKTKYNILWASQPEPSYLSETNKYGDEKLPSKVEEVLFATINNNENLNLFVRNHPNEKEREYSSKVRVCNDESLIDVLENIDLVVTLNSIVGFEALLLGKELITINLSVLSPMLPYSNFGYGNSVEELSELESLINKLYQNRNKNKKRPYNISNATNNVCREIISLFNE